MKTKLTLLIITILIGLFSCINPIYPKEQVLQHLGTILLLIPLFIDIKKNKLSLLSFFGIILFIIIHIIGARYIYSYVPYKNWLNSLFYLNLDTTLEHTRNHYDRFVHLVFGILFFPYLMEVVTNWGSLSPSKTILFTWLIIQTLSLFYELFEWLLTLVMSAEIANNYNGQQGDMWDAHKDMALAMLGSTVMGIIYFLKTTYKKN